jgi:hypothetical protein
MFGFVSDAINSVGSAVSSVANTATNTAQSAFGTMGGAYIDLYGTLAPTVASFVGVDPNMVRNSYRAIGNTFNGITGGNYVSDTITGQPISRKLADLQNPYPVSYASEYVAQNQTNTNNPNNNNNIFIFGGIAVVAYLFVTKKIKF